MPLNTSAAEAETLEHLQTLVKRAEQKLKTIKSGS